MHYMTNNHCWFFVDCRLGESEWQTCLWRAEIPLGTLCLYMQDPRDMLEQIRVGGEIDDLRRSIFAHDKYLAQQDEECEARFLGLIDQEIADVLNNEICLCRERPEGVGRVIYDAVLRAFKAGRGQWQELSLEDVRLLKEHARHLWALAHTTSTEPPRFRLVAADLFWSSMFIRRGDMGRFDFCPAENWTNSPVMELEDEERELSWSLATIFPHDAARLFSDLGAIARTDPFRFESVKRLIAHAADLGLRHRPEPNEVLHIADCSPVPSDTH